LSVLLDFQNEVGAWGRETFGHDVHSCDGLVSHLAREVVELSESHDPEEAADCFILLLGHADAMGYDLLDAARAKMEINRCREWGTRDRHGVIEHVSKSIEASTHSQASKES